MMQFSFWEKDSFLKAYDLIVIGAGLVGLSSALFYKQKYPDACVLVVDKGFLPEGASTRNAGFACVGSITEHLADLEKETKKNVKERIKRRYLGLQLLRKTLGDQAINYEACGGYELFTDEEKYKEAAFNINRINSWLNELFGEDKVYRATTFEGYPVIYNRLEGALHPGKMMQTLLNKVQAAGVEVRWNCRVTSMDGGNIGVEGGAELETSQILIATNGFTPKLLPRLPIKPARGMVLLFQPRVQLPWRGTFHYDRGYIYFRNVGNRLLLGGARNIAPDQETVDSFGINRFIRRHLIAFARQTLSLSTDIEIEQEWSGIMGFTETKNPVLKRLNDRQVVAAGLSGMGIAIGMKIGKIAAKMV